MSNNIDDMQKSRDISNVQMLSAYIGGTNIKLSKMSELFTSPPRAQDYIQKYKIRTKEEFFEHFNINIPLIKFMNQKISFADITKYDELRIANASNEYAQNYERSNVYLWNRFIIEGCRFLDRNPSFEEHEWSD